MRKKKMTFEAFEKECLKFYDDYRWHYNLQDLRVWNGIKGDMRTDSHCFYLLWKLWSKCDMVMIYDPDNLHPFAVYVDWKEGAYNHRHFEDGGQFILIAELDDMRTALDYMLREPNPARSAHYHKCEADYICDRAKGETPDNTSIIWFTDKKFLFGGSFLEILEAVERERNTEGSTQKGRPFRIVHDCNSLFVTYDERIQDFVGATGDTMYISII